MSTVTGNADEKTNLSLSISDITDDCLISHGLRRYNEDIETILVNQDEILYPDIQNAILDAEK